MNINKLKKMPIKKLKEKATILYDEIHDDANPFNIDQEGLYEQVLKELNRRGYCYYEKTSLCFVNK